MALPGSQDPGGMRASDADRDRVAEVVREAAADGRITLDELEERLEAVYAARTYSDLEPITADLPDTSTAPPAATAPSGAASPTDEQTISISETMGSVERSGKWRVPGRISVSNPLGEVKLDFREATFLTQVVDVELNVNAGSAVLTLPEGATATVDVTTSWGGSVRQKVAEIPDPSGQTPHLRITGKASGGSVLVRHKKGWGSWLFGDDEDGWS